MKRFRRATVLLVAAAIAFVSACGGTGTKPTGAAPTGSSTPAKSAAAISSAGAPQSDDSGWLAEPTVVSARHVRGPAILPELAEVTYGLGRAVRFDGTIVELPAGRTVNEVFGLPSGFVAVACSANACADYYYNELAGRLLRLAGQGGETFVNRAGTLAAISGSGRQAFLFELPSGRRIGRSPSPPAGVNNLVVTGLDSDDLVLRGGVGSGEQFYLWHPGMSAIEAMPGTYRSDRELLHDWRFVLGDQEVLFQTSPNGRTALVTDPDMSSSRLSLLQVPSRRPIFSRQSLCQCGIDQFVWTSDQHVLVVEGVGSGSSSRVAVFDVATRRVRTSAQVNQRIRIDRSLENDESKYY